MRLASAVCLYSVQRSNKLVSTLPFKVLFLEIRTTDPFVLLIFIYFFMYYCKTQGVFDKGENTHIQWWEQYIGRWWWIACTDLYFLKGNKPGNLAVEEMQHNVFHKKSLQIMTDLWSQRVSKQTNKSRSFHDPFIISSHVIGHSELKGVILWDISLLIAVYKIGLLFVC